MTEASKVIHIRNVGHEISENDLLQLVHPFGGVSKLVMNDDACQKPGTYSDARYGISC
ncbi:unnamed protein product [Rhodiola kirilowii]